MIGFTDATILALTKLRTRKIRTAITILLASLIFGLLIAASLVMTGAFRSVESFRDDGLTGRYIVGVYPNSANDTLVKLRRNPQLIAEAKVRYQKLVDEKKAEADKLGLRYTQASDQPPYSIAADGVDEVLTLFDANGIVFDLFYEYFKDKPAIDEQKLKQVAHRYQAIKSYSSIYRHVLRGSTLNVFPENKEVFYDQTNDEEVEVNYVPPIIDTVSMTLAPSEVTSPFMLPSDAGWQPSDRTIPIILPQDKVERLTNNGTVTNEMSAVDKLAHLKSLRNEAMNLTFQACYRNEASNALIQQVIQQQKEIKAGASDKDYQMPKVIYELPDPTRCENPNIVSDTRTDEDKKQDYNQDIFDKKFSNKIEPESYFVTFKVVGISPADLSDVGPAGIEEQAGSVNDIIDDILKTSGIGQVVPQSLYSKLDGETKESYADLFAFKPTYFMGNEDDRQRYVEFANAQDAQRFIDEQGCKATVEGVCKPIERNYQLFLSFTNGAALDDIQAKAQEWFKYAMLAIFILAVIIMWITIGRTIVDGRHETAVFRAIGFRRSDIAVVYMLYTVMLSVLVATIAMMFGLLGAYVVDQKFSSILTVQAQYGFGGIDTAKEVSLIGFEYQQLVLILAACFATGVLSVIVPLISNIRRNPIRDMRNE